MTELDKLGSKFQKGIWSHYDLHDFQFQKNDPTHCPLFNFVKGFKNFSPYCTVNIEPHGFDHLLCAVLHIDIKPGSREAFAKAKADKRKSTAKQTPATHRTKRRSSEENRPPKATRVQRGRKEHEDEDSDYNDEILEERAGEEDIPKFKKTLVLKICLDPFMEVLFTSRRLPRWLQTCLARSLGVHGDMELVSTVRGDPRHMVLLLKQKGGTGDMETSTQAVLEHEWIEALQKRGRSYGNPLPVGPVTQMLGAMPNNFPTVHDITATYKKVPLSSLPRPVADVEESKLQECRQRLSDIRVSSLKVHLSSPSLLHLYYNSSREAYETSDYLHHMLKSTADLGDRDAGRAAAVIATATVPPTQKYTETDDAEQDAETVGVFGSKKMKPKSKINLAGVVTDVPFFMKRLRTKGTVRPVLEYK